MVFRKDYTVSMPANATVESRRRKATARELKHNPDRRTIEEQVAIWVDRTGKKRISVVKQAADGSLRIREKAKTYTARCRDSDGIVTEVATGCRDLTAAKARLAELVRDSERVKSGVLSKKDLETKQWQNVPISQHISDYIAELRSRGVNADRVKTSETYLRADSEECGFRWLRDLSAESLRIRLRAIMNLSPATYNWHSSLWVAFGWWLTGRRMDGKRKSQTGEKRIGTNPFEGFGKKDPRSDRRRVARSLTVEEMRQLLATAKSRPLDEALTVRRGPKTGEKTAKLSEKRKAALIRLGYERALIYKTAIVTGLRLNELRTLKVGDLSFGDVPFLVLRSANEKNRKGSSVPLRNDLGGRASAMG